MGRTNPLLRRSRRCSACSLAGAVRRRRRRRPGVGRRPGSRRPPGRGSIPTIRCGSTTTAPSTRPARCRPRPATSTTSSSTRSCRRSSAVDGPALNVNTLDEVPDSSWFTNRIGRGAPVARGAGARAGSPDAARHRGLADRRRQGRGQAAGLPRPGSRQAPLADRVRSAGPSRRWRRPPRSSARRSTTRSATTSSRSTSPTSIRRRSQIAPNARMRSPTRAGGRAAVRRAPISTRCWRARRAARTAASACSPAASPTDRRSAASATTASGPTIPTTSSRTSTGASCAATACSRPG